jgi:hypothetical protein
VPEVGGDHCRLADADLTAAVADEVGEIGGVVSGGDVDQDRGMAVPETANQGGCRMGGQGWQATQVKPAGQSGDGGDGGGAGFGRHEWPGGLVPPARPRPA